MIRMAILVDRFRSVARDWAVRQCAQTDEKKEENVKDVHVATIQNVVK